MESNKGSKTLFGLGVPMRIHVELSQRIFCFYTLLNAGGYDPKLAIIHPVREKIRDHIKKNFPEELLDRIRNLIGRGGVEKEYWFSYRTWVLCHSQPPLFAELSSQWKNILDKEGAKGLEEIMRIVWEEKEGMGMWEEVEPDYQAVNEQCRDHAHQAIITSLSYLRMQAEPLDFDAFTVIPNFLEEYHRGIGPKIEKTAYAILGPSPAPEDQFPIHRIQHEFLHSIINPLVGNVFSGSKKSEISAIREIFIHSIVLRLHASDTDCVQRKQKHLRGQKIDVTKLLPILESYEKSGENFPSFLKKQREQEIKEACLL